MPRRPGLVNSRVTSASLKSGSAKGHGHRGCTAGAMWKEHGRTSESSESSSWCYIFLFIYINCFFSGQRIHLNHRESSTKNYVKKQ